MSTVNLFYNASVKLTATYLLIIMFISLMFSAGIYRVSSQELERTIRRPQSPVEQIFRKNSSPEIKQLSEELLEEQNEELKESQERLRGDLVIINLFILIIGGLLSYYLARKTLQPIEETHEAQSRFTADASHELRTPITAMRAETELALTEPKLTLKDAKKQLESNMEELDKLTELSDGLLSLARLDNNGLEKTAVQLQDIISAATEKVQPLADKKKQSIKKSKMPQTTLQANEVSIVESIITLLENAIKYSPNKSDIKVQVKKSSRSIDIKIIDNGVGIKAVDLPHIFDRFYRADQSRNKTHIKGYGIGLSIAKSIIEAHNGKISVNSTPDKGSTFTITLPL